MRGKENTVQKCVLVPVDKYRKLIQNLTEQKQVARTISSNPSITFSPTVSSTTAADAVGSAASDRASSAARRRPESASSRLNITSDNDLFGRGENEEEWEGSRGGVKIEKAPPPGESDREGELEGEWGWEKYWQTIR